MIIYDSNTVMYELQLLFIIIALSRVGGSVGRCPGFAVINLIIIWGPDWWALFRDWYPYGYLPSDSLRLTCVSSLSALALDAAASLQHPSALGSRSSNIVWMMGETRSWMRHRKSRSQEWIRSRLGDVVVSSWPEDFQSTCILSRSEQTWSLLYGLVKSSRSKL